MSDTLKVEVQRLINAKVPEAEIGKFIKEYSQEPERGTVGQFISDLGDADWRSASQAAGGMVGGVLGSAAAPVAGTAIGGMLGGTAGGQVYDLIHSMFSDEKTNLGQQNARAAQDMLLEGAANTFLPPVVGALAKGVKGAVHPLKSFAKSRVGSVGDGAVTRLNNLEDLGFKPTVGVIGGAEAESFEQSLRNAPGSGNVMRDVDSHNLTRAREIVDNIGSKLGGFSHDKALGGAIRDAAHATEKELYSIDKGNFIEVNSRLPDSLPSPRFAQAAEHIIEQSEASPLYNTTSTDHIKIARAALEEMGEGGTLSRNSRNIIKEKSSGAYARRALGMETPEDVTMIELERALQNDVKDNVIAIGDPELLGTWEHANKFHSELMGDKKLGQRGKLATLRELMKKEEDGEVVNWITQKSKNGSSRLQEVFDLVPEVADNIRAHVFLKMASPKYGQQAGQLVGGNSANLPEVSFGTMLTNINSLDDGARELLFKKAAPEINKLISVADYFKAVERRSNFSNTDNVRVWRELTAPIMTGLGAGGLGGQSISGALSGAAFGGAAVAGKIGVDRQMARLITDPKFLRWLADTGKKTLVKPTELVPQMIRLATIAKSDPATTDDYISYMTALGFDVKKTKSKDGKIKDIEVTQ